jgi:hypothetical protein
MTGKAGDLRKADWTVRDVSKPIARRFIRRFHYARGEPNTGVAIHGLFRADAFWDEEVLGVAWWLPPTKPAALHAFPDNWRGVLSLSRLAVHPTVPRNGPTFLLGSSMRLIDRQRWPCLLTFADERMGHTGAIYEGTNWTRSGKTKSEAGFELGGVQIARKAGPKTRTVNEMAALGAIRLEPSEKHRFLHIIEQEARP